MKFYICEHCGNIVTFLQSSGVPVMCCGQKMTELVPDSTDAAQEKHVPVVTVEGSMVDVKVGSAPHPMIPEHYIQWWPLHGKTMDDFRRAVRDAMRGGEETVTQEQFDAMMADYLARRGREKPSDWSENARRWAEEAGLVSGDSAGMRYRDFTTREETIQFLYRYQQVTEGKP